jgi:polar amino acid transport system substrate-binding protein
MKKIISLVLAAALMLTALFAFTGCANEDDGVLTCGVTIFDNMNELDENGNWTGFESEFAMEVGKLIGMEVKFQQIDWGQKYNELNSGKIDCIWNGFTANSSDNGIERKDLVDFSYTYMLNQQCVVIRKDNAEAIKTEADLAGKKAAVESGSAGATYAAEATGSKDNLVTFAAQNSAFMEVKTGKSDIAVVDILLAQNICGKGDYEDLMIVETITLSAEYYAVGFKKGSELTAKVNEAIKTLNENGKLLELAKKYGLENSLKVTY